MAEEMKLSIEIPGLREYVDKWIAKKKESLRPGQVVDTDALMVELQDAVKEYIKVNRIIHTEVIPRTVKSSDAQACSFPDCNVSEGTGPHKHLQEKRDNPYVSKLEKRNDAGIKKIVHWISPGSKGYTNCCLKHQDELNPEIDEVTLVPSEADCIEMEG